LFFDSFYEVSERCGANRDHQERDMTRRTRAGGAIALAALGLTAAAGAAGCGNSAGANSAHKAQAPAAAPAVADVNATLSEFHVAPATPNARAGKVTFTAKNTGKTEHELIVIRTDKQAADLGKGSRISESGSAGEVASIAPGATKSNTLDLKPGHYALICNLPGHYTGGMHTDLTVT
jgi:uncharacterized cupredoxin-like copper-binding protein